MTEATGSAVSDGGSLAIKYLKDGFQWAYDKLTKTVIPCAAEQIPKLMFIISNSQKNKMEDSGEFCVLEIDDELYSSMRKNKQVKKRIIVPLGTENDENFIKYLQN